MINFKKPIKTTYVPIDSFEFLKKYFEEPLKTGYGFNSETIGKIGDSYFVQVSWDSETLKFNDGGLYFNNKKRNIEIVGENQEILENIVRYLVELQENKGRISMELLFQKKNNINTLP